MKKFIIIGCIAGFGLGLVMLAGLVFFGLHSVFQLFDLPALMLAFPWQDRFNWALPVAVVGQWTVLGLLTGGLAGWCRNHPVFRRWLIIVLLVLGLAVAGLVAWAWCQPESATDSEPEYEQMLNRQPMPVSGNALISAGPDQLEAMDVTSDNQKIALAARRGEAWVKDPLQVALHCVGPNTKSIETRESEELHITQHREAAGFRVILDKTHLPDDSTAATKDDLLLRKHADGFWQIDRHQYGWRCWEGRGHTNYSCVPCQ